jgi:hypothetical protein
MGSRCALEDGVNPRKTLSTRVGAVLGGVHLHCHWVPDSCFRYVVLNPPIKQYFSLKDFAKEGPMDCTCSADEPRRLAMPGSPGSSRDLPRSHKNAEGPTAEPSDILSLRTIEPQEPVQRLCEENLACCEFENAVSAAPALGSLVACWSSGAVLGRVYSCLRSLDRALGFLARFSGLARWRIVSLVASQLCGRWLVPARPGGRLPFACPLTTCSAFLR